MVSRVGGRGPGRPHRVVRYSCAFLHAVSLWKVFLDLDVSSDVVALRSAACALCSLVINIVIVSSRLSPF